MPDPIRTASDLYYKEDVTGDLPEYQTVSEIATHTQALAEAVVRQSGGRVEDGVYFIPVKSVRKLLDSPAGRNLTTDDTDFTD